MALLDICKSDSYFAKEDKIYDINNYLNVDNFINNYQLAIPPYSNPCEKLAELQSNGKKDGVEMHFDHGTTTLGFRFQGGVILAVDSRATGGQWIASQTMKKVVEINDYFLGTIAGGAADCVYWDRVLAKECRLHELRNKERISVAAASKTMANIAHEFKGSGLSMGMMLAGYDKRGPGLYYVDSDGNRTLGTLFSVGSGSIYAFGVLDSGYNWDLTDEAAQELGRRAIYHATFRDSYSGGIIRVYHITKNGWVNISNEDCMDLHYKYQEEKENNDTMK